MADNGAVFPKRSFEWQRVKSALVSLELNL